MIIRLCGQGGPPASIPGWDRGITRGLKLGTLGLEVTVRFELTMTGFADRRLTGLGYVT